VDAAVLTPRVPPVPLVVGGRAPAVLERAGRLGDGWLGIWSTPEGYARRLDVVRAAAAAAGRSDRCVDHGLQLWCGFGADGRRVLAGAMEDLYRIPFERFERFSPVGSPAAVAEALAPYVDAGCRSFNIAAHAGSWEEAVEGLGEVRALLNA
jgi:alkanesulfonate monooxygenase SsuD/methylene tetrahydromethanopterin reductase-like flavin-dependent oxidoreductase (luciferase family)